MCFADMTEGYRQGIGGVTWLWDCGQAELKSDHFLNLLLGTGTVIGYCLFDLGRGVPMNGQPLIAGRQNRNGLRLTDGNGRLDVLGEKGFLDGDDIRLVLLYDFYEMPVYYT